MSGSLGTAIMVFGGVGLFLLGMTVMTDGLKALGEMQRGHRMGVLASVGPDGVTAAEAFARVDAARRLDALAHHAWRSAAHLIGRDERETAMP